MHLPNLLTLSRLLLTFLLFLLLFWAIHFTPFPYLFDLALFLFLLASLTDAVDGYLARRLQLESDFGRMADPLIDKIMISGCFIFFLAFSSQIPLAPWMVVLIVSREFLVSGLRGYAESRGHKFGANQWGKLKMICQSVTVGWIFFVLSHPFPYSYEITAALLWGTVVITLWSGLTYLWRAKKLLRESFTARRDPHDTSKELSR